MKHTSGPWFIRKDTRYKHAYGIEKSDNGARSIIALMNDAWLCEEHGDLTANAALISVAPELLEACKSTRFVINSDPSLHHLRSEPWFERLNNAIAKVEGISSD